MWVVYGVLLSLILINTNVFLVWILIEFMFLYFILIILLKEIKRVGLIIYFFFQGCLSLFLFLNLLLIMDKIIFLLLIAKLGLFPFFYWIVVVSVKIGYLGNIFVLGLQKIRVFWMLWLYNNISLIYLYFFCYISLFFVVIRLSIISDIWLFLVYSSIANTGIIILSLNGVYYYYVVILYLRLIIFIIFLIKYSYSFIEIIFIVYFFLVVPPFILFFIKFFIIRSLDFFLKLGFFLRFFDVLVLFYYFSFIFIKILLMDTNLIFYFINFFILFVILLFRNCVTMIIFNES